MQPQDREPSLPQPAAGRGFEPSVPLRDHGPIPYEMICPKMPVWVVVDEGWQIGEIDGQPEPGVVRVTYYNGDYWDQVDLSVEEIRFRQPRRTSS